MRSAVVATLALFVTLFKCTAAQSPIVTTSTSDLLSDDLQSDSFSEISTPDDDMSTVFDDSTQFTDGSETDESGVQSAATSDSYTAPVDESAAVTTPSPVAATSTATPSPVAPTSVTAPTPIPAVQPTTASTDATAATPAPIALSTTSSLDASTATTPAPTNSIAQTSSTSIDDATDDTMTGGESATPAPTVSSSGETESANTANGAAGLWDGSLSVSSTAAVGVLGAIALRFAGEL